MNHKLLIATATFFLLILDKILLSSCYDWFTSCNEKFRCGDIEADFPFIGGARPEGCGHPGLSLDCKKDNKVTITIKDVKYQVLGLNQSSQTLKLARTDFTDGICSPRYPNTSLDAALFEYSVGSTEITLVYGCTDPNVNFLMPNSFTCRGSGERGFVLLGNPGGNGGGVCRSVVTARVEMSDADFRAEIFNVSALEKALKEGFGVNYKVDNQVCEACKESGGVCGYDIGLSQTTCYCADRMWASGLKTCSSSTGTEAGSQLETPESKSGLEFLLG